MFTYRQSKTSKVQPTSRDSVPPLRSSFTAGDSFSFNDFNESSDLSRTSVKLHEFEEKNIVMEASISSITWFKGNIQDAARCVRSRVKGIFAKNPWLNGRLMSDPENGPASLQLVFDEKFYLTEYEIDKVFYFKSVHDIENSHAFYLGMNFQETTKLAQEYGYTVKPAKSLIDSDEPIFKVSIVPDSSQKNQFALIVSLCHRVGDGFTFYSLYNMLDPTKTIVALNPKRKLDVVKRIEERMGKKMMEGIGGFWIKLLFARDMLLSKVRGDKWAQKMFIVDHDHVKTVKENKDWLQECERSPSTNDIIVSECFNVSKPDSGMMSINFRGRIENCDKYDAPNYFNTILYRPRDYATPALIRKSISGNSFAGAAEPPTTMLLSSPSLMTKNIHVSICTNWATFTEDSFSLGPELTQILHMPLKDMQYAAPSLISNFTVFKPWPKAIAICATGTPEMVDSLSRTSLTISNPCNMDPDAAPYFT
jgi:hypothetical protein